LTISWRVLEVRGGALVNYTIIFHDVVKGFMSAYEQQIGDLRLTFELFVDEALNVYEKDVFIGRWPFWVRGRELNSNITVIHNYLGSPLYNNVTVRLMDFGASISKSIFFKGDITKTVIHTPYMDFHVGRLLYFSPIWIKVSEEYDHYEAWGAFGAFYDKESFIMVAYHQCYLDDVLQYYFQNKIVSFINFNDDIVLSDTNVYELAGAPKEEVGLIRPEIIVIVTLLSATGIFLGVYHIKRVKKKGV
jgi:hypothetical protein